LVITQLLETEIYFVRGLKKTQNHQQFDEIVLKFLSSFVEAWIVFKVLIPFLAIFNPYFGL
jgi:hypothetical protein